MDPKAVVLKAKELLSRMSNASYLTRESFVTVCTAATKQFVKRVQRERQQRDVLRGGRGASVEATGPDGWTARDAALLRDLIEHEAAALVRRLGTPGRSGGIPVASEPTPVSGGSAARAFDLSIASSEPPSFQLANASEEEVAPGAERPHEDSFAVLSQATVDAAAIVKSVLDVPYAAGTIRRSDYQQIVVAVVNHVLHGPKQIGAALTAENISRLREAASACLAECFARYAAELADQAPPVTADAASHRRPHSAPSPSAPHLKHAVDRSTSRSVSASCEQQPPAVHTHTSGIDCGDAATPDEVTFEDQVESFKKMLHASIDSFPLSNAASDSGDRETASVQPIPPNYSDNSARRQALMRELKGLHEEAGLLQAKMNIVLRELMEL
jgi:hypothetical protein